jgi:hypothetical protein
VSQAAEFATHRPGYWQETAAKASKSLPAYCAFVRGLDPTADHHWHIINRLVHGGHLAGGGAELILGPPGIAKTQYGVCWVEWTLGRDPNWRQLIASETASGVASTMVTEIGETISDNERFHMTFGHLKGSRTWSTQSLRLRTLTEATPEPPFPWLSPRGRLPGMAHPNVKAVGWRTGYTGLRADGLMCDDLVSERSSRSRLLTEAIHRTLHQKLLSRLAGAADPRVFVFGQRWDPRDLYELLLVHGTVIFDNNPGLDGLGVLEVA